MKKSVLGVKIDDITMDQATEIVVEWLSGKSKHYIVTPNPEIVMMAQKDQEFKAILNNADLSIPDGVGLKLSGDIVCHIPGIDFLERLVELSEEKGFTIGFLGGRETVAKEAAECLRKKYPKVTVKYALSGPVVNTDGIPLSEGHELSQVRDDKVDLLFVAFGPPKQEKWIAKNLQKMPVKVAMGVGGAFDYISGRVPRAPGVLRSLGLEWLFRLIVQPWRIKRQLSLIKYLVMVR